MASLWPAQQERAYATKLQDVISANPTATDTELDTLLVNALLKLSLVKAKLVGTAKTATARSTRWPNSIPSSLHWMAPLTLLRMMLPMAAARRLGADLYAHYECGYPGSTSGNDTISGVTGDAHYRQQ